MQLLYYLLVMSAGVHAEVSGPAALAAAGRPRAALCLRGAGQTACEGALWAPRWLLARASCLRGKDMAGARVLPLLDTTHCGNFTEELSISVTTSHNHPHWARAARYDAALVRLGAPAALTGDVARAQAAVPDLAPWLNFLAGCVEERRARAPAPGPCSGRVAGSPLRLFVAAILLPLAALYLLFLMALRLPWDRVDQDVPYDELESEGDAKSTADRL